MTNEEDKLPFTEHLDELRKRLIACFIAVGIGFFAAYGFKEKLFEILTQPLISVMEQGDKLIFTGIPEAFFTYLKVSFLAGLMLASPIILYQFWMFVAPGLYHEEKRLLIPIVFLSSFFFIGGALFGYFLVFPFAFKFLLLGFASDTIRPLPSMKEYLAFSSKLLIAFGVTFELPLVLTFLARLGIVSVAFLKKNRKYAILLFFIGSAILTPPDVVTQVMMALPLMLLYEISIIGARIFGKKASDEEATETVHSDLAQTSEPEEKNNDSKRSKVAETSEPEKENPKANDAVVVENTQSVQKKSNKKSRKRKSKK